MPLSCLGIKILSRLILKFFKISILIKDGYKGVDCSIGICTDVHCPDNSACIIDGSSPNGFQCQCNSGFTQTDWGCVNLCSNCGFGDCVDGQ